MAVVPAERYGARDRARTRGPGPGSSWAHGNATASATADATAPAGRCCDPRSFKGRPMPAQPFHPLRAVRLAQGKSLREVAAQIDPPMDPGALSRIERGLREPRTSTLRKICAVLGLERAEELLATFAPSEPLDVEPAELAATSPGAAAPSRRRPAPTTPTASAVQDGS